MTVPPEAQTAAGRVGGESVEGLQIFRGIPFARVPGRFRAAVPPDPWSGVRDATAFGPAAGQNRDRLEAIWGERLDPGSEDCLTVNVWTPGLDGRRPVLVLIHGGAFIIGSGGWPWMDGAALARRGDLVVVTFNYRLGAVGYLTLPEFPQSGNLGLVDQVAALEWVRANIANFGGDPANVTALGQSAGSISLTALLATPRARGLFQRAFCMSGAGNFVRTPEYAARITAKVRKLAGPSDLRTVPIARLTEIQHQLMNKPEYLGELPFGPTFDGDVLPAYPLHAIAAGSAADVQLIAGTTADEIRLWVLYNPLLNWLSPAAIKKWYRALGLTYAAVDRLYRAEYPLANKPQLAMAVATDALFWMPTLRLLEAQAKQRADSRTYLFAWPTQANGGQLGACHASDMPFWFGNLDASGAQRLTGSAPRDVPTSNAMVDALIGFARTGDPNHAEIPDWPTYPERRSTLVFNETCRIVDDPHPEVRAFWDHLPFDSVRPATTDLPKMFDVQMHYARWLGLLGGGMLLLVIATGIALALR